MGKTTTKAGSRRSAAGDVHADRRARLRKALASHGVDAVLVTDPIDVGYLTGFLGGDSYLLLPATARSKPVVISDFRYQEELEPLKPAVSIHIRRGSFGDSIKTLSGGMQLGSIAVQGEHVSLAQFDTLGKAVGKKKLRPITGLVTDLRIRKDETEIAQIRRAVRVQEAALLAVLPTIEPGQTELEIAARLEAEMKSRGSSQPGFNTIVAAGANGSLPHYRPQRVKVRKNQPLLIDWGSVVEGYHGDMTRTFAVGNWSKTMIEIYDIVHEAHLAAAAALAPGKSTREIDGIARDHIAKAGYAEYFGHGLGHGMGMQGHEDPRLNPLYADRVLEPGHVVTIEPGIYLPGVGGVRLEDDFVVTERGAKNLCSLPMDRGWATLC